MGEGHSSNRTSDNLQECPSKALAPHRDSSLPYISQSTLEGYPTEMDWTVEQRMEPT